MNGRDRYLEHPQVDAELCPVVVPSVEHDRSKKADLRELQDDFAVLHDAPRSGAGFFVYLAEDIRRIRDALLGGLEDLPRGARVTPIVEVG